VVILLVVAVVGGVWWTYTRHMDFVTPPSPGELAAIRIKVESSLPRTEVAEDAISAPPPKAPEPPPPAEPPKPEMDLGDLTTPPTLQSYAELSPQGAGYMIELATALEKRGEFQRALLAWERVIDLTKPDDSQAAIAISSIKRLRPTLPDWTAKPEEAVQIVLHAGTGKTLAKNLAPVLEGVARDVEAASSGTVKIKAVVTPGKTNTPSKGPAPVALWLAGPEKQSPSTEVLSFTVESPEKLRGEVMKTVFLLVRSHLSRLTAYMPPADLAAGEDPQNAINFRVTRLCWSEFAAALNLPPKKTN